jgi:hypothetical protein
VGQGNETARGGWWPAWANFDRPEDAAFADGGIWVIDPKVSPSRLSRLGGAKT